MGPGIKFPDEHYVLRARFRGVNAERPEAAECLKLLHDYERLMAKTRAETDAVLAHAA